MRQWLDEDSRKLGKTFGVSTALGSAGSFFLFQFSLRSNPTGPAATASAAETQADPDPYTSANSKG